MRIGKSRLGFALLTALLVMSVAGCASKAPAVASDTAEPQGTVQKTEEAKAGPFKDMRAPDFTLKDLEGTAWKLSELKGGSVALVFFTSW